MKGMSLKKGGGKEEKKKKIVIRVHGNSDCRRSKTYGSICLAHDPINHEN